MNFVWDEKKNSSNRLKHGISFPEAAKVFSDVNAQTLAARLQDGELRMMTIGSIEGKMWTVLWTERGDDIRIFSARRSRKQEEKLYEKG